MRIKVKNRIFILLAGLFTVFLFPGKAQDSVQKKIMIQPYFAKDKSEVMLAWDYNTGQSKSWYYDKNQKKFVVSGAQFQLPADPGVGNAVMLFPYLANDGSEVVLAWNTGTGKSIAWYYDISAKKFMRSTPQFQLPQDVDLSGHIMMQPYKGKDGSEVILVWDVFTGNSVSWYYDLSAKKFIKASTGFQLPQDLGLGQGIMMHAYLAKDKSEVIYTWNIKTGESVNWYYDNEKKKYMRSPDKFQLPAEARITGNTMLFPFIAKDASEVVWMWNTEDGKCDNWYYDLAKNKYLRSPQNYQVTKIPENGMLVPYLAMDGTEVLFTWDMKTGKSVGWYYDYTEKKYKVSTPNFQLPENPL